MSHFGNIGHHLIVAIIDHIPNGWVMFNGDMTNDPMQISFQVNLHHLHRRASQNLFSDAARAWHLDFFLARDFWVMSLDITGLMAGWFKGKHQNEKGGD